MGSVKGIIRRHYFTNIAEGEALEWAPEVHLGKAVGFVDYVGARMQKSTSKITDFICVELQAAGTTGTPWKAFQDHKRLKRFTQDAYNFGINWANEFAKTMMQQAYKKGLIIERWKKHIIFVIQDIGLKYLEGNYDTSGLREANDADAIHFCTVNMAWSETQKAWKLEFARRLSTDTVGWTPLSRHENGVS
jgi:hypothetical protein